jgi:hypothetical protein
MLELGLIIGLVAIVIVGSKQILASRVSASLTLSSPGSTNPGSNILMNDNNIPVTSSDSPGGVTKNPEGSKTGAPLRGGLGSGFFGR